MQCHVLVIDDDFALRDLFKDILELAGYAATAVATFAAADVCIADTCPDAIVVDYYYGVSPLGRPWLRALRADPRTANVPVVVCSVATQAMSADADYFASHHIVSLEKPFHIDHLLHTIEHLLAESSCVM